MKDLLERVQYVKRIMIEKQMYEPAAILRDVEKNMEKEKVIPDLTPSELERLAVLSEELGEVQQIIGKILRFGYESYNPLEENGKTNREKLEMELGDVNLMVCHMEDSEDISIENIEGFTEKKSKTINKWLHHNKVEY